MLKNPKKFRIFAFLHSTRARCSRLHGLTFSSIAYVIWVMSTSIDRLDRHKHPLAQFVVSPILKLPTFVGCTLIGWLSESRRAITWPRNGRRRKPRPNASGRRRETNLKSEPHVNPIFVLSPKETRERRYPEP